MLKKNVELDKLSKGLKAVIILELYLKYQDSNYPIIIDQPEDDLDSKSVSRALVNFLRDKRRERQIIIATHSPILVVNGDR